ncbi:hypothetical protein XENOCAPTIV_010585, partial [Xenoophorus captivus]
DCSRPTWTKLSREAWISSSLYGLARPIQSSCNSEVKVIVPHKKDSGSDSLNCMKTCGVCPAGGTVDRIFTFMELLSCLVHVFAGAGGAAAVGVSWLLLSDL